MRRSKRSTGSSDPAPTETRAGARPTAACDQRSPVPRAAMLPRPPRISTPARPLPLRFGRNQLRFGHSHSGSAATNSGSATAAPVRPQPTPVRPLPLRFGRNQLRFGRTQLRFGRNQLRFGRTQLRFGRYRPAVSIVSMTGSSSYGRYNPGPWWPPPWSGRPRQPTATGPSARERLARGVMESPSSRSRETRITIL